MDVFDLYAKISLDSKGYEKGLDTAKTNFDGFKTHVGDALKAVAKITAAATATVAGASIAIGKSVVTNAKEIAAYGDDIDKMSQKMGMSAETYQEWDAVMQHSGTSIESMKASMKTLANAAQTNNEAFEQLGITEKELKSLNQEELFAKTIEELQKVDDTTQRTYLAGKLLGRGATELGALLNTSAEDTKKMKERVHQLGGVMSNEGVKAAATFQDNLQDMKTALSGLKRGIFNDTLPAFNDLMDGFTKLIAGEEGAEDKIDSGMKKLITSVDKIVPKIQKLTETLLPKAITIGSKLVTEIAKSLPKIIAEAAPTLFNAGVEIITSVTNGIYDMLNKSNFDEKAKTMTEKVNNMIEKIDTDSSAEKFSGVINKFINAGFNIASTFDFKKTAEKMTTWLNKAVNNLDTGKLGKTVSDVFKGVWDFIGTALEEIDWEDVGAKISEFINEIDWSGILDSMFKVIGGIIKAAPELLKGVIENLDFESAANAMAVLFAPKAATKLFNFFKTDSATKKTLENAGGEAGGKVSGGMLGKFSNAGSGIVGKISTGLQTASILASAFSIGWTIGTQIKKGLDDIGWGQWIDDKINKFMDIVNAAERAKMLDTKAQADARENLAEWKKAGFTWLREEDFLNTTKQYRAAYDLRKIWEAHPQLKAAGYTPYWLSKLKEYDPEKFEKVKRGDLSAVGIKPATPTTYKPSTPAEQLENQRIEEEIRRIKANWRGGGMPDAPTLRRMAMGNLGMISSTLNGAMSATNIYLDTGKLVGGTSRTSATQNNYAMRGYAT